MEDQILETYHREKRRIGDFLTSRKTLLGDRDQIFFELMFCISVPQSKAPVCRSCLEGLMKSGELKASNKQELAVLLKGIRFQNNKSKFIVLARNDFDIIYGKIQELKQKPKELRVWILRNVKGIGMKEASHLLRNLGFGEDFAILDVHILRTMKELGLIDSIKLTKKRYFEYEIVFQNYARQLGLKPAELDIAIWLMKSGNHEMM
ncbi:MAG: DNA lyase [Candidatus Aenigmatarchaeota archaeon]